MPATERRELPYGNLRLHEDEIRSVAVGYGEVTLADDLVLRSEVRQTGVQDGARFLVLPTTNSTADAPVGRGASGDTAWPAVTKRGRLR